MAYVNVLEWKSEQVADWLRGLDDAVCPYAHFFLNADMTGQGLLNLCRDDLYRLHVEKLGHQEIILHSVEMLKHFHYNLDQENLQYISLKLSCKARSLYNEITMRIPLWNGKQVVTADIMSSVADVIESARLLLSWLERKPFHTSCEFRQVRASLIKLSLELATNAQRDTFAEQPVDVIRTCCDKLANIADGVIQEVTDPLILQPASLDVATIRKRPNEELGVVLDSSQHGIHLVTDVNMLSPTAGIQAGDEIVQVNYQTVVGWQIEKVVQLMSENPSEVILTLKKRPRHSNLSFAPIYKKPFRIPVRKKSSFYNINNLPSPRTELLVVPDLSLPILKKKATVAATTPAQDSSNPAASATPSSNQSSVAANKRPTAPAVEMAAKRQSNSEDVAGAAGTAESNSGDVPSVAKDKENEDAYLGLSEDDSSDDSEYDEAFLPVVASDIEDHQFTNRSKMSASPTSSLRSVLSRPRSAPQRRATISGLCGNYRHYINVAEIWDDRGKSYVGAGGDSGTDTLDSRSRREAGAAYNLTDSSSSDDEAALASTSQQCSTISSQDSGMSTMSTNGGDSFHSGHNLGSNPRGAVGMTTSKSSGAILLTHASGGQQQPMGLDLGEATTTKTPSKRSSRHGSTSTTGSNGATTDMSPGMAPAASPGAASAPLPGAGPAGMPSPSVYMNVPLVGSQPQSGVVEYVNLPTPTSPSTPSSNPLPKPRATKCRIAEGGGVVVPAGNHLSAAAAVPRGGPPTAPSNPTPYTVAVDASPGPTTPTTTDRRHSSHYRPTYSPHQTAAASNSHQRRSVGGLEQQPEGERSCGRRRRPVPLPRNLPPSSPPAAGHSADHPAEAAPAGGGLVGTPTRHQPTSNNSTISPAGPQFIHQQLPHATARGQQRGGGSGGQQPQQYHVADPTAGTEENWHRRRSVDTDVGSRSNGRHGDTNRGGGGGGGFVDVNQHAARRAAAASDHDDRRQTSLATPQRRRTSGGGGIEMPTPTSKFKSYYRRDKAAASPGNVNDGGRTRRHHDESVGAEHHRPPPISVHPTEHAVGGQKERAIHQRVGSNNS